MKSKTIYILIIFLLLGMSVFAREFGRNCNISEKQSDNIGTQTSANMIEYEDSTIKKDRAYQRDVINLTDYNGNSYNINALLDDGKYIVFAFFFTVCPHSQADVPDVVNFYSAMGCNNGDVILIGLEILNHDSYHDIDWYITEFGATYPIAPLEDNPINITLFDNYGLDGTPTYICISPNGTITELSRPLNYGELVALGAHQGTCQESDTYTITARSNNTKGSVSGGGTYPAGTQVTLTATPINGCRFTHWNDNNTENPRIITVTRNATYIAYFEAIQYTISTYSANESMGSVTGGGTFSPNNYATLTAIPNDGYVFTSWNDGSRQNPRRIMVTDDAIYIANFTEISAVTTHTITAVSSNNTYGTVSGGGIFAEGTIIELVATANEGYRFVRWSDNASNTTRRLTVTEDATYTAIFEARPYYTITAISANSNQGTVTGGGTYAEGTSAQLRATAYSGYAFLRWNDGYNYYQRNIVVSGNATYIASFAVARTITVNSADDLMGSAGFMNNASNSMTLAEGASVTIIATPNEGYRFLRWNDGNTDTQRTITVTSNATYTAIFEAIPEYTITVLSSVNDYGTATGGGTFDDGTVITLTATPYNGYVFTMWNDGDRHISRTVTVTGNAIYIASFADISSVATYTVTAVPESNEYGTVSGGGTFASGCIISISVIANLGYRFSSWSDGNTDNPRIITVSENTEYIAQFTETQNIILNSFSNGNTFTTCNATLYDSGGPDDDYSANEDYSITFCGENNAPMIAKLISMRTESVSYDYIKLYDGPNIESPLLATIGGSSMPSQTEYQASGNCITVKWHSDGSVQYGGFELNIRCGFPCQNYMVTITPEAQYDATEGAFLGCSGSTVSTRLDFSHNNENYEQTIENTEFFWRVQGSNGTRTFNGLGLSELSEPLASGVYFFNLTTTDVNGCENIANTVPIYISVPPTFTGTSATPEICPGTETFLTGVVNPPEEWQMTMPEESQEQICFDDYHSDEEQISCFYYTGFATEQTILSPNDIESIGMRMEHSYMGDLDIMIQCPNGQRMILFNQACGAGYFGEPVDNTGQSCNDGPEGVGIGYDYYWTMENNNGLMSANCPNINEPLLPGNYQPVDDFGALVGCPINGEWCVIFIDYLASDDGTLFQTELHFADHIVPVEENIISFQNTYGEEMWWEGDGIATEGFVSNNIGNPTTSGNVLYTFHATDNFGCTYDTTLTVYVRDLDGSSCCIQPIPTLFASNTQLCGYTTVLVASQFAYAYNTGEWTYTGPGTATFSDINQPVTDVTVSALGNYMFTWHEHYMGDDECTGEASVNVIFTDQSYIYDESESNIELFPNPVGDLLYINAEETISEIEIVNVMGQVVLQMEVNNDNAIFNVEYLTEGVYCVRIYGNSSSSNMLYQRKFIKK